MDIKDICTKKTWMKYGAEKTKWFNVGTLKTTDNGKQFIELNMYPSTQFYIFEQKKKDVPATPSAGGQSVFDETNPF